MGKDKCNLKNKILVILYSFIYVTGYKNNSLIYILLWKTPHFTPALDAATGQEYFINNNCRFKNCFATTDRTLLRDLRDFDVILFNMISIHRLPFSALPSVRSPNQKYILMSNEPAQMYSLQQVYNGYFNYTFTYKLDSDVTWRFFLIKNNKGEIIGPKKEMHWMDIKNMKPITTKIKRKLRNKKTAAAWFVSHCETESQREQIVEKLITYLQFTFDLRVDVYGKCANIWHKNNTSCGPRLSENCYALIESDYYFYLAFENSFCEDYVTEKILTAIQHYAVPVVYGGANYSRFVIKVSPCIEQISRRMPFFLRYGRK